MNEDLMERDRTSTSALPLAERASKRFGSRQAALVVVVAAGTAAFVVGALVLAGSTSDSVDPRADFAALQESVSDDGPGTMYRAWTTLSDTLPNVAYLRTKPSSAGEPLSVTTTDSVVLGTITDVSPEFGVVQSLGATSTALPSSTKTSFDDERAAWRSLRVTLRIEETLAGSASKTLVLSWPVMGSSKAGQPADAISRALKDLGTVVVLSRAASSDSQAFMRRTALDFGYGIATVAADGRLAFPLIAGADGPKAGEFTAGLDTVDELRAELRKPVRTMPLERF